jgi:ammonia channel protein AmtB
MDFFLTTMEKGGFFMWPILVSAVFSVAITAERLFYILFRANIDGTAFMAQVKAVLFTLVFSGVGSLILFKIVDVVVGLRVAPDAEREGLDIAEHGERAYHA